MGKLVRISQQLTSKNARKGSHPRLPSYGTDILYTARYWRSVRSTGAHAADQYRMARSEALSGSPLARLLSAEGAIKRRLAAPTVVRLPTPIHNALAAVMPVERAA